jgi:hypothetical protein
MKRLGFLVILGALSGCILVNQQMAETAKTALVGKSRSQILACAGIPNQTFRDGATEYMAYYGSGNVRTHGSGFVEGNSIIYSGGSRQAQCVVNIAIRNDYVSDVNYRSSGGAITAPDEACGIVLRGCL